VKTNIPLLAAKECPVCHTVKAYNVAAGDCPVGWIDFSYRGAREYVCSETCAAVIVQHQNNLVRHLKENRETLEPDIIV